MTFERDFAHHPMHYFILICILTMGLWGIFWFAYSPAMRLAIMIALGVSYVVWGAVHHLQHHDFHIKIVVEYALMATLAVLVFATLLYLV